MLDNTGQEQRCIAVLHEWDNGAGAEGRRDNQHREGWIRKWKQSRSPGSWGQRDLLRTLFIDTSALAKRYLSEVGSTWVRSVTAPAAGHVVIIAGVTVVEMFSLLARRGREGTPRGEWALVQDLRRYGHGTE